MKLMLMNYHVILAGEGGGVKVGLGFTEDMALELRSSTEELDFHEPEPERKTKRKKLQQQQAVVVSQHFIKDKHKINKMETITNHLLFHGYYFNRYP